MFRIVATFIVAFAFVAVLIGCSKSTQPSTEGAKPLQRELPKPGADG